MPLENIAIQRLYVQQLEAPRFTAPADLVPYFVAVQSQDYAGAKWSMGRRLPGCTDAAVDAAITAREIVRGWVPRGTLHFVAAADIGWMLALLAGRLIEKNARRYHQLELDEKTLARSNDILAGELSGGRQRTRKELLAVLEEKGIATTGQRAPFLLQRAVLDGLICQSVTVRNDPAYFALDELASKGDARPREEALAELARRYFTSRGPATLQDFIWWSGLTAADARQGLDAVQSDLCSETYEDRSYWMAAASPTALKASPAAYLLPAFDEYMLGYTDRSASLDTRYAFKVDLGNGLSPTFAIDGRIAGLWKRTVKKSGVVLHIAPFTPLTDAEKKALAVEARRYGEFLSLPISLG